MSRASTGVSASTRVRRGAIGIFEESNKLLMIRRAEGISKGGFWCFPGGHVETGETSKQAIKRELTEELGIEVQPRMRLGSLRVLGGNYVLAVWLVKHVSGRLSPAPNEVAETRWVAKSEVPSIRPGLASNRQVLELLEDARTKALSQIRS